MEENDDQGGAWRIVNVLRRLGSADLRILRKAVGRPRGHDPAVFDLFELELWRPIGKKSRLDKRACYLTATLFAWHPLQGVRSNSLANAIGRLQQSVFLSDDARKPIRNRFRKLLAARKDEHETILLYLVKWLRTVNRFEARLDWVQFLRDVNQWNHPEAPTQRRWAEQYLEHSRLHLPPEWREDRD